MAMLEEGGWNMNCVLGTVAGKFPKTPCIQDQREDRAWKGTRWVQGHSRLWKSKEGKHAAWCQPLPGCCRGPGILLLRVP